MPRDDSASSMCGPQDAAAPRQMRRNEELAIACITGDTRAVRAALQQGAGPNCRYRDRTLLNWAAQEGREGVAAVLLAEGADPNAPDRFERVRPLHTAAGSGHIRIVRRLLRAGAKTTYQVRGMGTPLHLAASFGHLHCVRALVRAGADVRARDADGKRPVQYARRYRCRAVVAYLREVESAQ